MDGAIKTAPQKTKKGTPYKKKHPSCGQKIKPVCGIYVVNLKNQKISPKFRNNSKEKSAVFYRKQRIFGPSDRI